MRAALALLLLFSLLPLSPSAAGEQSSRFTPGDLPDTIKLTGSSTSFGIGGFAKLHLLYSDVTAGHHKWGDQYLSAPDIPIGGRPATGQQTFKSQARETRLWFKSLTPSAWGDVNTYLEYDLYKLPAAYKPRLRHAYVTVGSLLAGQTFTTFTNSSALADTETGTPAGNISLRQKMLRWTQPLPASGFNLMFALEVPQNRVARASATSISTNDDDNHPDIVVRLNNTQDWGSVSLAALTRRIAASEAVNGAATAARGSAVSLAGRINTGTLDNLRFMLSYGDGFSRYVFGGGYADGILDHSDELHTNTILSSMLAYQHYWSPRWRSTLALSHTQADLPAAANSVFTRKTASAQLNLIWTPTSAIAAGIEYLFTTRARKDQRDGDLNRVQLSLRYNF